MSDLSGQASVTVINSVSGGVSDYAGGFSVGMSLAGMSEELYLLTCEGLFRQSGVDDDGTAIDWTVTTGKMRLNGGMPCNVFQVNPLTRAEEPIYLSLLAKKRGNPVTYGPFVWRFPDRDELREWPTQTGEGHAPTAYAVQLTGTGPAEIRGLSVYVNPHVRGR